MSTYRRAAALLALCCLFWGLSFPCSQIALAAMARIVHHVAPETLGIREDLALRAGYTGLRFLAAALISSAVVGARLRGLTRTELFGGLAMALLFTGGLLLQLAGLRWTVPSISAVLTALTVVLTPLAQALIARRAVAPRVWIASAIAALGMALLALPNPGIAAARTVATAPPWPFAGEALTVGAALLFTAQIFAIDRWAGRSDPARFTAVTLWGCAIVGLAVAAPLGAATAIDPSTLVDLLRDPAWSAATAANVLLASVIGFHLMNAWQPRVSPAVAAVIYCSEPAFALLSSLALRTERLTAVTALGGGVVLLGVALVATRPTAAAAAR